jgi:hypothetical protein
VTDVPADAIEQRRRSILAHETAVARQIAAQVVERPTLSVWMILIPLLFVHYMQRQQVFRRAVAEVSDALLRSRWRALDLVCARVVCDDEPGASEEDDGIRRLRSAQDAELALLARHYSKLLAVDGSGYPALVRRAYGTADAYREQLNVLQTVERRVSAAAYDARRDESSAELLQRLERARLQAQSRELELTFG